MGNRANFVLIRDGEAVAHYDQWAALGSTYSFADGPDAAVAAAQSAEPTEELLDWAFAEAGFLLDFDERRAIVFGYPEPLDFDAEELEELGAEAPGEAVIGMDAALQSSPLDFLRYIAPRWQGWMLVWDDRGVDAFAEHLSRRGISSIAIQPKSHPPDRQVTSLQA